MRRLSILPSSSPALPRAPLDAVRRHLAHLSRVVRTALGRFGAGLDLRGTCSIRGAVPLSDIAAVHAAAFGDAEAVCTVALGMRPGSRPQRIDAGRAA